MCCSTRVEEVDDNDDGEGGEGEEREAEDDDDEDDARLPLPPLAAAKAITWRRNACVLTVVL
jgi:hypothetical protein